MSKKKIKPKPSPEIQAGVERAASELTTRLAEPDAAETFQSVSSNLAGFEPEIIEALSRHKSAEVLNFLYRLSRGLNDKASAKIIKKAIYRLEQAGLSADAQVRPSRTGIIQPLEKRLPEGYLSEFDHLGARSGLLAVPSPPSGYASFAFMIDLEQGLNEIHGFSLTATALQKTVNKLGESFSYGLISVPAGHVKYVLTEAAARSRELGLALSEDYEFMLNATGSMATSEKPVIYNLLSIEGLKDSVDLNAASIELMRSDLVPQLLVSPREIDPFLNKMDEIEKGVLILTEAQKNDRRQDLLQEAVNQIFQQKKKAVFRRMLEETALLALQLEKLRLAEAALATAQDLLREAGPLSPHPFLREYLARVFKLAAEEETDLSKEKLEAGEVRETGSRLILPG